MKRELIWAVPNNGYRCTKEYYDIALIDPDEVFKDGESNSVGGKHAFIMIYTHALAMNDEARNVVLNRICKTELTGVPVDHVHLVLMMDRGYSHPSPYVAFHYDVHFDVEKARRKHPDRIRRNSNPLNKRYSWLSHSIQCGDVEVFCNALQDNEMSDIGVQRLLGACESGEPEEITA